MIDSSEKLIKIKTDNSIKNTKKYDPLIRTKFEDKFFYREKPFFIIPQPLLDRYKKDVIIEKKQERGQYTPKTEVAKRSDAGFYQTFYNPEIVGIFADYDDMVAQFIREHPNAKLSFDEASEKVVTEEGQTSPKEINDFIQNVKQYEVTISAFDTEGSMRRIEERKWFRGLEGINLASRTLTLMDLQRIGLLSRTIPDITQQEIQSNHLTDPHKQVVKKFYRRRQQFWHPDMWKQVEGLTKGQKQRITDMATKLNRLRVFI